MAYIGNKPANKAIVASDLDPAVITGQTALAVAPADTDEFLISDAGTLKRIDASLVVGGGKLLQSSLTTTNTEQTISSSTYADLTGMTVDITPVSSTSKFLITAFVNASLLTTSGGSTDIGFNSKILRDSTTVVDNFVSGGSNIPSLYYIQGSSTIDLFDIIVGLDDHNTSSEVTIKVQGKENESNTAKFNRGSSKKSYLLVQEIET